MKTKAEKYYKKGQKAIDSTIQKQLKGSNEVVYGARSVNKQLPRHLQVYTEDWDIATTDDPETEAKKIEKALDKRYGGNYFRVVPALHPGTFKVISNVTFRGVADVTLVEDPISHRKIGSINYATLDYQLERIKDSLNNPESSFRHKKDLETKQRIIIATKKRKRKPRSKRETNAQLKVIR